MPRCDHLFCRKTARLIDALLTLSRPSQDQLNFVKVNLTKWLLQICDDLEFRIKAKEATIEIDSLPVVEGIPLQLGQV